MTTSDAALSFGRAAGHYDQSRPSYPREALQWALGGEPLRVVDLGAGTGLLTRVLLDLGHDVVAVEPDPGMRSHLEAATPGLEALAGSAESIPVDDSSVDAVVAGQAYHWFDRERANPEIARVLEQGGVFAPLWNLRDEEVAWVAELTTVARLRGDGSLRAAIQCADFGPLFAEPEFATFPHSVEMTADRLVDLVRTRSSYLVADEAYREQVEAGVRSLVATHPTLAGHETFELPYLTRVNRAFKHSLG